MVWLIVSSGMNALSGRPSGRVNSSHRPFETLRTNGNDSFDAMVTVGRAMTAIPFPPHSIAKFAQQTPDHPSIPLWQTPPRPAPYWNPQRKIWPARHGEAEPECAERFAQPAGSSSPGSKHDAEPRRIAVHYQDQHR